MISSFPMFRLTISICMLALLGAAQSKVDFEMMTWPEVKHAIESRQDHSAYL